jgi:GNAT superfamily N-acetyltransferase
MEEQINIREPGSDEIEIALRLVSSVFDEFVAPLFSEEGINQFRSFIELSSLEARLQENGFMLVAEMDREIVGVIAMRDWNHIFLLFVDGKKQRKGIAKMLLDQALQRCKAEGYPPERVTVNSSPNAVEAYRRMGFVQTAEEEIRQGVRAVPMAMELSNRDAG